MALLRPQYDACSRWARFPSSVLAGSLCVMLSVYLFQAGWDGSAGGRELFPVGDSSFSRLRFFSSLLPPLAWPLSIPFSYSFNSLCFIRRFLHAHSVFFSLFSPCFLHLSSCLASFTLSLLFPLPYSLAFRVRRLQVLQNLRHSA